MSLRTSLLLAAFAFGAVLLQGPAMAPSRALAQDAGQAAPSASPPSMVQPSDGQLKSFAAATLAVDDLHQQWKTRIAGTSDPQKKQEMQTRAMQQMAQAVRDKGLSVDQYNRIVEVMKADPKVAKTVKSYRREMSR